MKYCSIFSVMVKSAMTPSFIGRMAVMWPGVRPSMFFASWPTASIFLPRAARLLADRDDRRLVEHDALAANVDQSVCGAQIDRQVVGEIAAKILEHGSCRSNEWRAREMGAKKLRYSNNG